MSLLVLLAGSMGAPQYAPQLGGRVEVTARLVHPRACVSYSPPATLTRYLPLGIHCRRCGSFRQVGRQKQCTRHAQLLERFSWMLLVYS